MLRTLLKLFARRPLILIAVLLVLAGVFAFVSFRRADGPGAVPENPNAEAGRAQAPIGPDGGSETLVYTHPDPAFSFSHPSSFTVAVLPPDDTGQTILVRNSPPPNPSPSTRGRDGEGDVRSGQKQEFQIRISEFDEPGPITKERILKDIPDMVIEDPQEVLIGFKEGQTLLNGASALTFLSQDVSLGRTREVWFVSGGFLYQITAYAEMDETLGKILQTWGFSN